MTCPAFEIANAHDTGDCLDSCTHPDHSWDGPLPDLWVMLLGPVRSADREREFAAGPVCL